jgi:hypothetical protein
MAGVASKALSGSDQQVMTGHVTYMGFSARETGGANPVIVRIFNGTSTSGILIETIRLAASESSGDWYGPQGIRADSGIFVAVTGTGTVEGTVRHN